MEAGKEKSSLPNPLDGCLHVYLDVGSNRGIQVWILLLFVIFLCLQFSLCKSFKAKSSKFLIFWIKFLFVGSFHVYLFIYLDKEAVWARAVPGCRYDRERGSQRDVVYLGWPIASTYMSPNAGGWGGEGARGLSQWVHLWYSCAHGA